MKPTPVFISFDLIDAAGILFFAHVLTLSHHVFETAVIPLLGLSWKGWFNNGQWIAPVKQCEATYQKPLLGGQTYAVHTAVSHLGDSSFALTYRFCLNDEEHCSVKIVHVFCDQASGKKMPIPNPIRHRLESLKLN